MDSRRRFIVGMGVWLSAGASGGARAGESRMAAGTRAFMAGRMEEALREWDAEIVEDPATGPHHWQRGIALYYAGKFKEGRTQFEGHQKVNSQDVENAAWHFCCVARAESVQAARQIFIPVTDDSRVPMREIHALFAGKGTAAEVLAAVEAGADKAVADGGRSAGTLRNQRCYAQLYLGLYYEALGKAEKAEDCMVKAAFDYRMDHYMGKVAQVHCRLRGWKPSGK